MVKVQKNKCFVNLLDREKIFFFEIKVYFTQKIITKVKFEFVKVSKSGQVYNYI